VTANGTGRPPRPTGNRPNTKDAATTKQQESRANGSARAALATAAQTIAAHRNAAAHVLADTAAQLRDAVNTGPLNRVTALTTLTLAAEAAGVARRDAEYTITAALWGAP
jgi:hypothetical protein